jgi:excisionase family DNA binding protein
MAGRPQNAHNVLASSSSIMTLVEVAEFLRVNPSTHYRLLKESRIPCFRVGSDYRFNRGQRRGVDSLEGRIGRARFKFTR